MTKHVWIQQTCRHATHSQSLWSQVYNAQNQEDPNAKEETALGAGWLSFLLHAATHLRSLFHLWWKRQLRCLLLTATLLCTENNSSETAEKLSVSYHTCWQNSNGLAARRMPSREQLKLNSRTKVTMEWWDLKSIHGTKKCVYSDTSKNPAPAV